ncbi:MAG: hypothetical protein J6S58_02175 [Lentisphaeria bacterium]|nr:hypothetical protein [Lentisphaeria bacterium]
MNLIQKRRERINYLSDQNERRRLTSYLQAGYFRRVSHFHSIDNSSVRAKGIFYFLAGSAFLTGVLFVLF